MAGNSAFTPVSERGWRHGLGNLLDAGFAQWWKTRLWWVQTLIWTAVINLILAGILWSGPAAEVVEAPMIYSIFTGMMAAVAVVIIMQDAIVGEKQSGTAAWILSKPVSRTAFIISKLIPNALGVLVTMVLVPGIFAYAQMSAANGSPLPPFNFLAGQAILWLDLIFYLTLTLMLGTFFNHRGPVIGLALAFLFAQQYLLGLVPQLIPMLPYTLSTPLSDQYNAVAAAVIQGQAPYSWLPVIMAAAFSAIFVLIAIRQFHREEF